MASRDVKEELQKAVSTVLDLLPIISCRVERTDDDTNDDDLPPLPPPIIDAPIGLGTRSSLPLQPHTSSPSYGPRYPHRNFISERAERGRTGLGGAGPSSSSPSVAASTSSRASSSRTG